MVAAGAGPASLEARIARVGELRRVGVGERHGASVPDDPDHLDVELGSAQEVLEPQADLGRIDDHLLAGQLQDRLGEGDVAGLMRAQPRSPARGCQQRGIARRFDQRPRCSGRRSRRSNGVAVARRSVRACAMSKSNPRSVIRALTAHQKAHSAMSAPHEQRYRSTSPIDVHLSSPTVHTSGWAPSNIAVSVEPEWLAASRYTSRVMPVPRYRAWCARMVREPRPTCQTVMKAKISPASTVAICAQRARIQSLPITARWLRRRHVTNVCSVGDFCRRRPRPASDESPVRGAKPPRKLAFESGEAGGGRRVTPAARPTGRSRLSRRNPSARSRTCAWMGIGRAHHGRCAAPARRSLAAAPVAARARPSE